MTDGGMGEERGSHVLMPDETAVGAAVGTAGAKVGFTVVGGVVGVGAKVGVIVGSCTGKRDDSGGCHRRNQGQRAEQILQHCALVVQSTAPGQS